MGYRSCFQRYLFFVSSFVLLFYFWWVKSLFHVSFHTVFSSQLCFFFFTTSSKPSEASLRQSIMYHLLFIWLMENAAGLALCALSVLSATSPSSTAPFRLILTTNCSSPNILCVSWSSVMVVNSSVTEKNAQISFWFPRRRLWMMPCDDRAGVRARCFRVWYRVSNRWDHAELTLI